MSTRSPAQKAGDIGKRIDRRLRRLAEHINKVRNLDPTIPEQLNDKQKQSKTEELLMNYTSLKTQITEILNSIAPLRVEWEAAINSITDEGEKANAEQDSSASELREFDGSETATEVLTGINGHLNALNGLHEAVSARIQAEQLQRLRVKQEGQRRRGNVFRFDDERRADSVEDEADDRRSDHGEDGRGDDNERQDDQSDDNRREEERNENRRERADDERRDRTDGDRREREEGDRSGRRIERGRDTDGGNFTGFFNTPRGHDRTTRSGINMSRRSAMSDVDTYLPKIDLMEYSGSARDWIPFYETFLALVDSKPIPDIAKAHYLLSKLKGDARLAVAGYQPSEANYPIILQTLKKRFGNSAHITRILYQELNDLPKSGKSVREARTTCDAILRICRSMHTLGESVENLQVRNLIESKLPSWLITDIYKEKVSREKANSDYKWSTKDMLDDIESNISLREDVALTQHPVDTRSPAVAGHSSSARHRSPGRPRSYKSAGQQQFIGQSSAAFAAVNPPTSAVKCLMCQGLHRMRDCDKYKTAQEKWKRAKDLGLCLACLKPSHFAAICPNVSPCTKCNTKHHPVFFCVRRRSSFSRSRSRTQSPGRRSKSPAHRSGTPQRNVKRVGFRGTEYVNSVQAAGMEAQPDDYDPEETEPEWQNLRNDALEHVSDHKPVDWGISMPIVVQTLTKNDIILGHPVHLLTKFINVRNPSTPSVIHTETLFGDSGSMLSMCTEAFAEKLRLEHIGERMLKLITLHSLVPVAYLSKIYKLEILLESGEIFPLTVYSKPELIGSIMSTDVRPICSNDPENVYEVSYYECEPGILLGSDYLWLIDLKSITRLENGATVLGSKLGYMAAGRISRKSQLEIDAKTVSCPAVFASLDAEPVCEVSASVEVTIAFAAARVKPLEVTQKMRLEDQVEYHFALESSGIFDDPVTKDEERAIEMHKKSLNYRLSEKRYYMGLLWKDGFLDIPTDFTYCFKRLEIDWKTKYKDDPWLLGEIYKYFKQMLDDKVIKELESEFVLEQPEEGPVVHYNHWFAVVRPDKTTTQTRPVWDASAKSRKGGRSLNDCLLKGANFLISLIGFLLYFRTVPIAVFGDVKRAYLQLGLNEPDTHACRFLFLRDLSKGVTLENLVQYAFQRVAFGINCSGFLLMATIREHLRRQNSPLADELIRTCYSDNLMVVANSPDEAINKVKETVRIFDLASMTVRDWFSNSAVVNQRLDVPASKRVTKVLGVDYNTETDVLSITFNCEDRPSRDTKRSVLQANSKNYDPMQIACPAMVRSKLFFQRIFSVYPKWKDFLSADDQSEWDALIKDWDGVKLEFPRLVAPPSYEEVEVHGFADANPRAMCVAIYLVFAKNGKRFPVLVLGKSRLAPSKKPPTLPRLELTACQLAVKVINFVREQLQLNCRAFLWTDSKITLAWILTTSKTLAVYVANRVKEIRKIEGCYVGYVPTDLNPADYGTKGLEMSSLRLNNPNPKAREKAVLWFHGPPYLQTAQPPEKVYKIEEHPSISPYEDCIPSEFEDEAKAAVAIEQDDILSEQLIDLKRFSNINRAWHALAYATRFIIRTHRRPLENVLRRAPTAQGGPVSLEELKLSKHLIVRQEQNMYPPSGTDIFENGLQRDPEGIVRCSDRLKNAGVEYNSIFIPYASRLVFLLLFFIHKKNDLHVSAQQMLSIYREHYWSPRARSTARQIVKYMCNWCKRERTKPYPYPPLMPALPDYRVQVQPAFLSSAVDMFGHILIRCHGEVRKIYVALFCCLVTRMCHPEACFDLSADSFIKSFRRFCSRRGKPALLLSDNQSGFLMSKEILEQAWNPVRPDSSVMQYMTKMEANTSVIASFWRQLGETGPRHKGSIQASRRSTHTRLGNRTHDLM